jgi:hypothetical protein
MPTHMFNVIRISTHLPVHTSSSGLLNSWTLTPRNERLAEGKQCLGLLSDKCLALTRQATGNWPLVGNVLNGTPTLGYILSNGTSRRWYVCHFCLSSAKMITYLDSRIDLLNTQPHTLQCNVQTPVRRWLLLWSETLHWEPSAAGIGSMGQGTDGFRDSRGTRQASRAPSLQRACRNIETCHGVNICITHQ